MKISPWVTLFIGYVLGYVLYPILQLWTCHCDSLSRQEVPLEAFWSESDREEQQQMAHVSREEFIQRYLDPPPSLQRPQKLGRPRTLSGEYQVQKRLFVAVITAEKYLSTRARAVYDTWGSSVTQISFFVGADCNTSHPDIRDLPVVRLPGIPDNVYPPQKKVFAVLHYIHKHYIGEFQWFMRADDDVYIRGDKLENLLSNFNYNEKVYLGLAGKGKTEDINRLGLQPHERYCMGGPGVILSKAALSGLAPNLDLCLSAVDRYNEENPDNPWYNEDVELGRCVSRSINIQCSSSAEGRTLFIQDYTSAALRPQSLWQSPAHQNLITIHPIKQPENLYAVHHFFLVARASKAQGELQGIEGEISSVCQKIPDKLAPPWQIMPTCSAHLCSGGWTRVGVDSYSSPIAVVTKLPKVVNPPSVYELVPWEHFSTATKHSITGASPEEPLPSSFLSEIAGVVGLVESHLNSVRGSMPEVRVVEVVQGYTRFTEEGGREYILDLMLVETDSENSVRNERVRLIRPLSPDITMVTEATPTSDTVVNIVITVSEADDSFSHFLEWYYLTTLTPTDPHLHLILCVTGGDTHTLFSAQTTVANLTRLHPSSRTTILSGPAHLSPSGALELGVSILSSEDLVFIADTNLRIRPFFFDSCRANTLPGNRAYFPVPYVMFEEPSRGYPGPGRWSYYSTASVCMYKSDFLRFSDSPREMFEKVSGSGLEVFQAPDPGLIRVGGVERCEGGSEDGDWDVLCRDLLTSAQFETGEVDYLHRHDQAGHKSLSFIEL